MMSKKITYFQLHPPMINTIRNLILNFFNRNTPLDEKLGGGLLGIGEQDTDYVFWSSVDLKKTIDSKPAIVRPVIFEYNQWAQYETRNWCTIYSAVTEVSWLMNYKYSLAEILVIGRLMIKDWKLDPNNWAYLHTAVDYVRRDRNKRFPNKQLESYRIDYLDADFKRIMRKAWTARLTQIGYRTSSALFKEVQSTGKATKKTYNKTGWHAVSQWGDYTINNYSGKTLSTWKPYRNRFKFIHRSALIKNWIIFRYWYMFLVK